MTALRAKRVFLLGAEHPHGRVAAKAFRSEGAHLVLLDRWEELPDAVRRHGAPDFVFVAVTCADMPRTNELLALRDYRLVNDERVRSCYLTIRAAAQVMRRGTIFVAATSRNGAPSAFLDDERVLWARLRERYAYEHLVCDADVALAPRGIHVRLLWREGTDVRAP